MDEIDFIIIKKLMENSRVTYRELADMTNMSISAIPKRVNKLVDDEIIKACLGDNGCMVCILSCPWLKNS